MYIHTRLNETSMLTIYRIIIVFLCVKERVKLCGNNSAVVNFFSLACEIWPNYKFICMDAMWIFLPKSNRNPPEQVFVEYFSGWIDTNTFCGIIFAWELILFYSVILLEHSLTVFFLSIQFNGKRNVEN